MYDSPFRTERLVYIGTPHVFLALPPLYRFLPFISFLNMEVMGVGEEL